MILDSHTPFHSKPRSIVINHANTSEDNISSFLRHLSQKYSKTFSQKEDLLTGHWKQPDVLISSGRGYARKRKLPPPVSGIADSQGT